jgi:hypothetical protein
MLEFHNETRVPAGCVNLQFDIAQRSPANLHTIVAMSKTSHLQK